MVLANVAYFILSGFDYFRRSISLDDNSDGGQGMDGIASIGNRHFLTVAVGEQSLMQTEDRVLVFFYN